MELIFGIHDYIFLTLIGIGIYKLWNNKSLPKVKWWWFAIWFVSFFLILPVLSAVLEVKIVTLKHKVIDSFNLFYVFFRFPTYWLIGIIVGIVAAILGRKQEKENTMP